MGQIHKFLNENVASIKQKYNLVTKEVGISVSQTQARGTRGRLKRIVSFSVDGSSGLSSACAHLPSNIRSFLFKSSTGSVNLTQR